MSTAPTRWYIRSTRGYVSGVKGADWTTELLHARSWVTSEAAHEAAHQWYLNNGERLVVEVRTPVTPLFPTCR